MHLQVVGAKRQCSCLRKTGYLCIDNKVAGFRKEVPMVINNAVKCKNGFG